MLKSPPSTPFDPATVVAWARQHDPTRLLDTNSGGPANFLGYGDVNDTHDYPWPLGPAAKRPGPIPTSTQYAMLGEMGGMGSFTPGHMWAPMDPLRVNLDNKGCFSYGHQYVKNASDEARAYEWIVGNITLHPEISASVYTQTTDVENECDGFLNYDRTKKFDTMAERAIRNANFKLIGKPVAGS